MVRPKRGDRPRLGGDIMMLSWDRARRGEAGRPRGGGDGPRLSPDQPRPAVFSGVRGRRLVGLACGENCLLCRCGGGGDILRMKGEGSRRLRGGLDARRSGESSGGGRRRDDSESCIILPGPCTKYTK